MFLEINYFYLATQKLFGVIGGALITLINSRKIKWGSVILPRPSEPPTKERV